MRKYLVIIALIFALAIYVAIQDQRHAANPTQQGSPPTQATISSAIPHDEHPAKDTEQSQWNPPSWHRFFAWPDGVTVWAIFLTLLAIAEQASEAAKATKAMRDSIPFQQQAAEATQKSADAAKISADVAAGISIPTLRVESFDFWDEGVASVEAMLRYPKVKLVVKNYGQTPAFLRSWSIVFTCEDLPEKPVYDGYPGSGLVLEKIVIEPGKSYTFDVPPSWRMQDIPANDVQAVIDRNKMFNAYGCVYYGDLFGSPMRRLKFCETIINVFLPTSVGWFDEVAPRAYRGNDYLDWKPVA